MKPVILNPAEGVAQIGSLQVPINLVSCSGHYDVLQIYNNPEQCLRSVSFLERTRIATYASVSKKPSAAIAKLITEASLLRGDNQPASQTNSDNPKNDPELDHKVLAIIALALAGANETDMPSFAASSLLLSQQSGWTLEQLGESNAADIDKLAQQAAQLLTTEVDDGWTRLEFNTTEQTQEEDLGLDLSLKLELEHIQKQLADNLLIRLQAGNENLSRQVSESNQSNISADLQDDVQSSSNQSISNSADNHTQKTFPDFKKNNVAENITRKERGVNEVAANEKESLVMQSASHNSQQVFHSESVNNSMNDMGLDTQSGLDGTSTVSQPLLSTRPSAGTTNPDINSIADKYSVLGRNTSKIPLKLPIKLPIKTKPPSVFDTQQHLARNRNDVKNAESGVALASPMTHAATNTEFNSATPHYSLVSPTSAVDKKSPVVAPQHTPIFKEIEMDDILDALAVQLHLEADLRGIDR